MGDNLLPQYAYLIDLDSIALHKNGEICASCEQWGDSSAPIHTLTLALVWLGIGGRGRYP